MSHPEVVVVEASTACDFALAAAVVEPVATIASAAIDAAAQTTDVNLFKLPHQESSDGLRRPDDSMTKVDILSRRALNRALLARQMLLLLDGSFAVVLLHRDPSYMEAAGRAAHALTAAALPQPRSRTRRRACRVTPDEIKAGVAPKGPRDPTGRRRDRFHQN